jgi:hypothetical protein
MTRSVQTDSCANARTIVARRTDSTPINYLSLFVIPKEKLSKVTLFCLDRRAGPIRPFG